MRKKSTKTSFKGTRHSLVQQGMRSKDLALNIIRTRIEDANQSSMKLFSIDQLFVLSKNSLEIVKMGKSAHSLITN